MDYAFNSDNQVLGAALSMTGTVPSEAIERTDEAAKAGGGDVRLTGPYTGAADVAVDVRIVDLDIDGAPSASAPVFTGVGNATITTPTGVDGMVAETWTLMVENLGTETRYAEAPFGSATLRATTPGARSIRIEVTPELTLTDTEYFVRETIPQDADTLDGLQWNYGASALTGDGDIPATAARRRIGIEPTVFRQYMKWDTSLRRYVYGFSPKPPRAIPAGALVRAVSGTYTMVVTEDDVVETYTGLVTEYDALDALRSRSAIVKPITAVVADHRPGGMAASDLSVITQSFCSAITPDGGEGVGRADILLVVGPNAPTENLKIEFVDASTAEVRGEISGLIGRASVGQRFESEHYSFLIPRPPTDPNATGVQTVLILKLTARDSGAVPALCGYFTRPGINLRNGTKKFVWGDLPPPPCACDDVTISNGPPSDDCLGIEQEETTVSDASRLLRMQQVVAWRREFITKNTYQFDGFANDIAIVDRGVEIWLDCLSSIAGGTLDNPAWVAAKLYKIDQVVEPSPANGFRYAIGNGGTSHTSAPAWSTTIGDTVTDGAGVTYTNIGKKPFGMWDDGFKPLRLDTASLFPAHGTIGALAQVWTPDRTVADGVAFLPTTDNGHYYAYKSGAWPGSLGATEPSPWPTDGSDVTVGEFVYRDAGVYGGLARSTEYVEDQTVWSVYHGGLRCIAAGETAATMPAYAGLQVNDTFVDGEVTWLITSRTPGAADGNATAVATDAFWARHEAMADEVRASAGINVNPNSSSGTEACWTGVAGATQAFLDAGSDEPGYEPVWPNRWSVLATQTPEGIRSTKELAFAALISCAGNLVNGDELSIITKGVTGTGSGWYQQGDRWVCEITSVGPVELGGGQTGNDTTTISVVGTSSGRLRDYLLYRPAPTAYNGGADAWDADAEYVDGDYVRPTAANGLRYRAQGSGQPGATEPTWPTGIDDTVDDGDVTWVCVGPDVVLGFTIAEGGIRLALGDNWTFAFEGGHFEVRYNGGAWSAAIPIAASVALVDGLVAEFAGGSTPSWAIDDTYSFRAIATAGVDNLRRPTGRSAAWITSTTIEVAPPSGTANRLILLNHTIPSNATITLQGSDNNWASTPLSVNVPWREGDIHFPITTPRAKYRLLVSTGGSIFWLFIGVLHRPKIRRHNATERGVWQPEYRMPTRARRGGVGGRIAHTWLPQDSWDALYQRIAAASFDDQRRFAIIPNTEELPVHMVALTGSVQPRDEHGFAPRGTDYRRISVDLELEAA